MSAASERVPQDPYDVSLVLVPPGRHRAPPGRLPQQIVTVQFKVNTESAGCDESLDCAHSSPLQPALAFLKLDEATSLTGISFPPFPTFPISPSPGSR